MTHVIEEFRGQYRFLSNFYAAEVELDNVLYPTVEHAYQAAKTDDPWGRSAVAKCNTPGEAKRAGRRLKLRDDWESVKVEVMTGLVRQKFTRSRSLGRQLLATGDVPLIEGNTWGDEFWGVCRGVGQNKLGEILMLIRSELRQPQYAGGVY